MIAENIVYIAVDTGEEAVAAWTAEAESGGAVHYYAGGTELATGARKGGAPLGTVIDIKGIPECRAMERSDGRLRLGAALPLNTLRDADLFPLLSRTIRHIADRSVRNRLSLGGNVAGTLPYREAVLPLLLAGAGITTIAPGSGGGAPVRRNRPLSSLFRKHLGLGPGELVLSFDLDEGAAAAPWRHYRATRTAAVDYPLVTACFLRLPRSLRMAVTGLHPYPVFSADADRMLSAGRGADGKAAAAAIFAENGPPRDDSRGSGEYRAALFEGMIAAALEDLA